MFVDRGLSKTRGGACRLRSRVVCDFLVQGSLAFLAAVGMMQVVVGATCGITAVMTCVRLVATFIVIYRLRTLPTFKTIINPDGEREEEEEDGSSGDVRVDFGCDCHLGVTALV